MSFALKPWTGKGNENCIQIRLELIPIWVCSNLDKYDGLKWSVSFVYKVTKLSTKIYPHNLRDICHQNGYVHTILVLHGTISSLSKCLCLFEIDITDYINKTHHACFWKRFPVLNTLNLKKKKKRIGGKDENLPLL